MFKVNGFTERVCNRASAPFQRVGLNGFKSFGFCRVLCGEDVEIAYGECEK